MATLLLLLLVAGLLIGRPRLLPRLLGPFGLELRLAAPASETDEAEFDGASSPAEAGPGGSASPDGRAARGEPEEPADRRSSDRVGSGPAAETDASVASGSGEVSSGGREEGSRASRTGSGDMAGAAERAAATPSAAAGASAIVTAGASAIVTAGVGRTSTAPVTSTAGASAGATATAAATETADRAAERSGSEPTATATRRSLDSDPLARASGGPMELPAPLLAYPRPFGGDLARLGSTFYPYGTTADGRYLLHHGIDIGNPIGSPVLSVAGGEVIHAGDDLRPGIWGPNEEPYPQGFYGQLVVIRHDERMDGQPVYGLYGHLSSLLVERRQRVSAGQPIARVGSAGIALGPHLHLEIRIGGRDYASTRNPEIFLQPIDGQGLIIGRVADPAGRSLPEIEIGLYRLDDSGAASWLRSSRSYPEGPVRSVDGLGENFVLADLDPGRYRVAALPGGGRLEAEVDVMAGRASAILLQR